MTRVMAGLANLCKTSGIEWTNSTVDEAAAEYARAIELSKDDYNGLGLNFVTYLSRWDEVFDRVARKLPDDPRIWIGHGRQRATQNRWQEAADDFRKGVRDRPISNGENTEYACLLLIVDDERGYQQFCSS